MIIWSNMLEPKPKYQEYMMLDLRPLLGHLQESEQTTPHHHMLLLSRHRGMLSA